jgi:hypothetical protein
MPNSDPDAPLFADEVSCLSRIVASPDLELPEEIGGVGVGLTGKGCPPDSRRLFTDAELAQTLAAAHEPYRTLFSLAIVVGPRISECLGLAREDLDLSDQREAMVNFLYQVDRQGVRQKLKTEESSEKSRSRIRSLACLLPTSDEARTRSRAISSSVRRAAMRSASATSPESYDERRNAPGTLKATRRFRSSICWTPKISRSRCRGARCRRSIHSDTTVHLTQSPEATEPKRCPGSLVTRTRP